MARDSKKKVISYEKPVKEKKETLMLLKSKFPAVEGKADGKVIIGCKAWFGKDYYIVLND